MLPRQAPVQLVGQVHELIEVDAVLAAASFQLSSEKCSAQASKREPARQASG